MNMNLLNDADDRIVDIKRFKQKNFNNIFNYE